MEEENVQSSKIRWTRNAKCNTSHTDMIERAGTVVAFPSIYPSLTTVFTRPLSEETSLAFNLLTVTFLSMLRFIS